MSYTGGPRSPTRADGRVRKITPQSPAAQFAPGTWGLALSHSAFYHYLAATSEGTGPSEPAIGRCGLFSFFALPGRPPECCRRPADISDDLRPLSCWGRARSRASVRPDSSPSRSPYSRRPRRFPSAPTGVTELGSPKHAGGASRDTSMQALDHSLACSAARARVPACSASYTVTGQFPH